MQGLSAFAGAQCPPFIARFTRSAPCPKQFLLVGFKYNSFLKCKSQGLSPSIHGLKTSPQDGVATEEPVPSLTEETVPISDDKAVEEGSKVQVKFFLHKECHFGQRFNVVGDDPLFGNWDVEAAIPMEWADGNVWTVEVDVPAEKQVEFKFVITGQHGDIEWQPGSNRMFKTVDGISPLVVAEPWESVDEAAMVEAPKELSGPADDTTPISGVEDAAKGLSGPADDTTPISGVEDAAKGLSGPADDTTPISGVEDAAKELSGPADDTTPISGVEDAAKELSGPADDTTPISGVDDAAKEEVVEALDSKIDETNGQPNPPDSESETASEVPRAELEIATTAVEVALGVSDAV